MTCPHPLVAIHGAPRSGTSWLGQIFNSHPLVAYRYQPMFSHAFKGRVGPASPASEFRQFFADLLATDDEFVLQRGGSALAGYTLDFGKSPPAMLVYKEVRYHEVLPRLMEAMPGARLVAIVRDPRDVIASWLAAPREFRTEWDAAAEWRHAPRKNEGRPENWYGFERWCALARLFDTLATRYPSRVRLVRYEDLVACPEDEVTALFDWCGLEVGEQTRAFLHRSRSEDDGQAYGVLRSAARAGLRTTRPLPPGVSEAIVAELDATPLSRFLSADQ